MMGHESYCGLCGGPQRNPFKWSNTLTYSRCTTTTTTTAHDSDLVLSHALSRRAFQWLARVRVLASKNDLEVLAEEESEGEDCFISGIGNGDFFPQRADLRWSSLGGNGGRAVVRTHILCDYSAGNIPVHDHCWQLLMFAIEYVNDTQYHAEGSVGLRVVKDCLAAHVDGFCTDFDFGFGFGGEHWYGLSADMWTLVDFSDSLGIVREFAESYPLAGAGSEEEKQEEGFISGLLGGLGGGVHKGSVTKVELISTDPLPPLHRLPTELITRILTFLPRARDVASFRKSTRAAATARLSQDFWKARVKLDFPYFFEYELVPARADWRRLYMELAGGEEGRGAGKEVKHLWWLAWRNRKRVWRVVVEEVAEECWACELKERRRMMKRRWQESVYSDHTRFKSDSTNSMTGYSTFRERVEAYERR